MYIRNTMETKGTYSSLRNTSDFTAISTCLVIGVHINIGGLTVLGSN